MALNKRTLDLNTTEEGDRIKDALMNMLQDNGYNTSASYSVKADLYPDHLIPFVDKHMHYLNTHPSVDPIHYLANLRLMTRVR